MDDSLLTARREPFAWTPERRAWAAKLKRRGASHEEIAEMLSERHNAPCSGAEVAAALAKQSAPGGR